MVTCWYILCVDRLAMQLQWIFPFPFVLTHTLHQIPGSTTTTYVVVNAVTRQDLKAAVHGCLLAEEEAAAAANGSFVCVDKWNCDCVHVCVKIHPLAADHEPTHEPQSNQTTTNSYRTAADWVAIRAGLDPLPPLPASFFTSSEEEGEGGGGVKTT